MSVTTQAITVGDIIEFTLDGERTTAEVMLTTDLGDVLLDLMNGEGFATGLLAELQDVAVFDLFDDDHAVAA